MSPGLPHELRAVAGQGQLSLDDHGDLAALHGAGHALAVPLHDRAREIGAGAVDALGNESAACGGILEQALAFNEEHAPGVGVLPVLALRGGGGGYGGRGGGGWGGWGGLGPGQPGGHDLAHHAADLVGAHGGAGLGGH